MKRKKRIPPLPIHSANQRRSRYKRWLSWFKQIKRTIFDLAFKRYIYKEITSIIEANPRLHVPSAFYDWMRRAYVTDTAISIRKLVDWKKDTISLVRLLQDIEDHPEVISRRRYVCKYKGWMKDAGHHDFEKFARPGAKSIDPRIIRRHRRELIKSQKRLRKFVNQHLAHWSRYRLRRLPTYIELDACLDLLEKLAKDYTLLLEQACLTEVVPVITYDWQKPFRIPWIDSEKEGRMY